MRIIENTNRHLVQIAGFLTKNNFYASTSVWHCLPLRLRASQMPPIMHHQNTYTRAIATNYCNLTSRSLSRHESRIRSNFEQTLDPIIDDDQGIKLFSKVDGPHPDELEQKNVPRFRCPIRGRMVCSLLCDQCSFSKLSGLQKTDPATSRKRGVQDAPILNRSTQNVTFRRGAA